MIFPAQATAIMEQGLRAKAPQLAIPILKHVLPERIPGETGSYYDKKNMPRNTIYEESQYAK